MRSSIFTLYSSVTEYTTLNNNEIYKSIFKEFENLSVEKMTLSTALGFEPRSFDCRSIYSSRNRHGGTLAQSRV